MHKKMGTTTQKQETPKFGGKDKNEKAIKYSERKGENGKNQNGQFKEVNGQ